MLVKTNSELSKVKEDLSKQVADLFAQLKEAKDDTKTAQGNLQILEAKLATKKVAPATSNDKALLEKVKDLEQKKEILETSLAEWTELAKVICPFQLRSWSLTVISAPTRNIKT